VEKWSRWLPFPDPRKCKILIAPLGPGVYELRIARDRELVLVGIGGNRAHRMCSLLPKPLASAP